jgi:hypothetical protein
MRSMNRILMGYDTVAADSLVNLWYPQSSIGAQPITGTISALVETGDIRLLNDSLRIDVLRYLTRVETMSEAASRIQSHYLERASKLRYIVEPYVQYRLDPVGDTAAVSEFDLRGMRSDPSVRAAYNDVMQMNHSARGSIAVARAATDTLLAHLDAIYPTRSH